ncbi:uncharacterized protein [Ambystoma mexicanum]|uniref:uncharacterized protein isoform X3 n=1 Tax=Ambystoma mexicanum TaxID=8296 RepID=UPI0037E70E85
MEALLSRGASVIIKAPEDEDPEKGGTLPNSITMSKCCALDRVDSGYLSAYNTVTLSSCSSDSLDALSLPGPGALDREAEPTAQAECEAGSQQLRGQGWRKRARSEDSGLGLPLFQDARNAGRDAGVNVTGYPLHPLARAGPRKKEKARTEGPGAHLQKLLPREVDTQPTETTAGDEKSSQKCLLPSKELRSDPYFMTVSLIAALLLLTVLILGAILSGFHAGPHLQEAHVDRPTVQWHSIPLGERHRLQQYCRSPSLDCSSSDIPVMHWLRHLPCTEMSLQRQQKPPQSALMDPFTV